MKICFRLDHDLVEHDTGKSLLFRSPKSCYVQVWVPWFLTSSYGCKKNGYLVQANEDFQFLVKTKEGDKRMTPNELIDFFGLEHDDLEADINEEIEIREQEKQERIEKEKKYIEEHKDAEKNWNYVKIRHYGYEFKGNGVLINIGCEQSIMFPAKLVKFFKKTARMPQWLAEQKQIAFESLIHVPEQMEVEEDKQPLEELVIND